MAWGMNVTFSGTLGVDGELHWTASGKAVWSASVAVDVPPNPDGSRSPGWWVKLVGWGAHGEKLNDLDLRKGSRVEVTGRLLPRTWTGRDGTERTTLEVSADTVTPIVRGQREREIPAAHAMAGFGSQGSAGGNHG